MVLPSFPFFMQYNRSSCVTVRWTFQTNQTCNIVLCLDECPVLQDYCSKSDCIPMKHFDEASVLSQNDLCETSLSYIYMGIRILREQSKCLMPEAEGAHCVEPAWSAHLLTGDTDRLAVCSCCEYCIFDKIFIEKFKQNLSYSHGHNYKTFFRMIVLTKNMSHINFFLFIEWTQRLCLFFIINISTNFYNQKLSSFLCRTCLMVKNNSGPWLSTAHSKCILVPQWSKYTKFFKQIY